MAEIHPSVKIGQGAVIEESVSIAEGTIVGPYAVITGDTIIGKHNIFDPHTIIGADPQDKKVMRGCPGKVRIGNGNRFREFSTVHRGHLSEEGTIIGDDNYFLVNAHVAHDCRVGNDNFIANNVLLAGHVEVGNHCNLSGYVGTHQFTKIGSYCMVSGHSGIRSDIYPYALVQGDPAEQIGINQVGLSRNGFSKEQIFKIKEAFRLIRKGYHENDIQDNEFLKEMLEFKSKSDRGMMRARRRK